LLKRIFSVFLFILLVTGMLTLAFHIQPVRAQGTIYIRADGSIDPPTAPISTVDYITYTFIGNINDAIVIERDNIVIDGAGYTMQGTGSGNGITLSGRSNVTIKNTEITTFYYGIYLEYSSDNSIVGNNITRNGMGIELYPSCSNNIISGNDIANNGYGMAVIGSSDNKISGNNITENSAGYAIFLRSYSAPCYNNIVSGNNITNNGPILLDSTSGNSISGNNITNNGIGLRLWSSSGNTISGNTFINNGLLVSYSYQNSVENNTVNGSPLVYLEGVSNYTVDDAGQVILVNCENIRVEGLNLSRTAVGVQLLETNNSIISGNDITNNGDGIDLYRSSSNSISGNNITANNNFGIYLDYSSSNSISGNNITNNGGSILLSSSSSNSIFHNNFISNAQQVYSLISVNVWDDGYPSAGNYWSDYTGVDLYGGPFQNITGSDGIGDTPYIIDTDNRDQYPLMTPYIGVHDTAVTNVMPSKTVVGQGYSMNITATATNQGDCTETFNVTLYTNTTFVALRTITLESGASTIITFTWNTSGFDYGNCTITAYAEPVLNETDLSDNTLSTRIVITIPGDLNGDFTVDIYDAILLAGAYNSVPASPNWKANADINSDNIVDIYDAIILASRFGRVGIPPFP